MQRIIVALAVLAYTFSACKTDDSAERQKFIDKCRSQIPSFLNQKAAEEYCDCNAAALFGKYKVEQVLEMDSLIQAQGPKSDSLMQAFQNLINPCREEFTKKTDKIQLEVPEKNPADTSIPSHIK